MGILLATTAHAQGTTPLALAQQMDLNGQPLAGCLVFFYVAGTVATPQNAFADSGLTQALPNPVACDQTGRVPLHWLANGLIHVRLTDASGNVQVDTTMPVIGGSTGGGGGGGTVDPTAIASTGDIKFRPTSETLTGWVTLNGQTIGSASSGATGRANADTSALFQYLWNNCINAHCPVPGGRGASGLADFNANKQITLYDLRDSVLVGRDCMGNTCSGGLLASNVTSGGDGVDTSYASGGASNVFLSQANLPNLNLSGTVHIPAGGGAHTHGTPGGQPFLVLGGGPSFSSGGVGVSTTSTTASQTLPALNGTSVTNTGGSNALFSIMNTFRLGTWYAKL